MGKKKALPRHSNKLQTQYRAKTASKCFKPVLVCLFRKTCL